MESEDFGKREGDEDLFRVHIETPEKKTLSECRWSRQVPTEIGHAEVVG